MQVLQNQTKSQWSLHKSSTFSRTTMSLCFS